MPHGRGLSSITLLLTALVVAGFVLLGIEVWRRPLDRDHLPRRDTQFRIDLNRADAATLAALPGIGPGIAHRIIADRQINGPFHTVDDIVRVNGIGPHVLRLVRDVVKCGEVVVTTTGPAPSAPNGVPVEDGSENER